MTIFSVSDDVLILSPVILSVIGVGAISPGVALGVAPGVTVNTQAPEGAIVPQVAGEMTAPEGNAGDGEYCTFTAARLPVLVMVIIRALPLVLNAMLATLMPKAACANVTARVWFAVTLETV